MTEHDLLAVEGISEETKKKASLYQVIEEIILAEHARFLIEDCGIDLGSDTQVEDSEGKKLGKVRS